MSAALRPERRPARPSRLVVLVCALLVAASVAASAASAGTIWSGSGTGSTSVPDNGAGGTPQFSYSYHTSCCASGSWQFSTVAATGGSVVVTWTYSGFNAYYFVYAAIDAFVTHSGSTSTTSLVNAGPAVCCSAPSAGFTYSGTTTFQVHAGDTYGFDMSGSNSDSNGTLQGTLTLAVTVVEPQTDRSGYCAAAGDYNGVTGAPIAPGTFLDLVTGQPDADPAYRGAMPAIYVAGSGITCAPPPAGYVLTGTHGINPYYAPPAS